MHYPLLVYFSEFLNLKDSTKFSKLLAVYVLVLAEFYQVDLQLRLGR